MRLSKFLGIQVALCATLLLSMGTSVRASDEESPSHSSADITGLSIEELMNIEVYGASKFEQKLSEAPSSVSVVTADEIKKYGYRTLADILRSIRGFYVTYDRNYSYVGVRGFGRPGDYNTRILLLVDGHRTNDSVYDSALVGTEFVLDVDLIDRIEIIRGPGSSLYGSNAFFAVVDVITKSGRDLKGAEVSGEAGSFDTYKGRLSYGNKFRNGLEAIFSASYDDSHGLPLYYKEFDNPSTHHGITENTDFDRYYSYFAKLSYRGVTLEGASSSRTKGIPTASFGTDFNDSRNKTTDSLSTLDLKYEHNLSERTNLTARLFYDYYQYKGDYIYSGVVNKDWAYGEWWGGDAKVSAKVLDAHRLIFGAEYQDNLHQDQKNYDEDPYFLYVDDKRQSHNWALYVQDESVLSKTLTVNAGVRYDVYSTFGGSTNPRIALIYTPVQKSIFKFLYGTAFRAPNVYELYYQSAASFMKSNPNLKPETINTYEIVYEQYIGNHFRGTASGFYYKIKDLISQTTDPADGFLVFRNTGKIESRGIELELENKWASGVEGRISYTFQTNRDASTGEDLTNSPAHLAKMNVTAPLIKEKTFLGVEEQFTSQRKTLAGDHTGACYITNVTLSSRTLLKGLEFSGSLYNLFGKKCGDPGAGEHLQDIIQQDGRVFRVKLIYAF